MSLSVENEEGSSPSNSEDTEEEASSSGMSLSGNEEVMSPKICFPAEQDTFSDLKR